MSSSLENLMGNLIETVHPDNMQVINGCRASLTNKKLDIEKRNHQLGKGLVPWPLITGRKCLKIARETLPDNPKDYYSILTETCPSKEQIKRAGEYYQKYKCANLLEYLMQYCETDMIQLVSQNF